MLLFTCCRSECSRATAPLRALLPDQWASRFKHGVSQQIDRPRVLDWYGEIMSHAVLPFPSSEMERKRLEMWKVSRAGRI